MRKLFKLILLALTLSGSLMSQAQVTIVPEWIKTVEPPVQLEAAAWSVCQGSDGYLYWSTNQPVDNPYRDQVLYKLDTDGNEIWPEPGVVRKTQTEQAYVVNEHNGIVYTAGRICDCANINLICCDFSIVAWDPVNGDTLWSKRYDVHGEYEECDGLVIEDTVMFVSGWTREAGQDWFDVLLMKLDLEGNVIWQTTWDEGIGKDERQDGHIVVDENHIFMCGISQGIPNNLTAISGLDGQATIWKFDRNGNYVHHDTWGAEEVFIDGDDALGMTTDGAYLYAVGYVWTAGDNADWFIRKYDKNLNLIWEDIWGGIKGEAGRAATIDNNGNIWASVNTFSYADSSQNLALLKYTPNGNLDGFYLWGDTADQHFLDIRHYDNALYCSGFTNGNEEGNNHPLLLKIFIDDLVSSASASEYPRISLNIFPNPSNEIVKISIDAEPYAVSLLKLYTMDGRLIHSSETQGKHVAQIDCSKFTAGTFIASIEVENRRFSKTFQVVK